MKPEQFKGIYNKIESAGNQPKINLLTGRPYDYSGKPTTNGKYSRPARPLVQSQAEQGQPDLEQTEPEQAAIEDPYLTLVIPAYNEAARLPTTLDKVLKWLESQPYRSEVVVVDDGSADETPAIVQRLIQQRREEHSEAKEQGITTHCRLQLIENQHRGKAFAVRAGVLQGRGEFILFSDADLCTPISEANKLLFWLDQGFDIAIGSREGVGARRYGEPFYRHLMGRVFNLIVRVVTNSPFQDTQCGFKAFTRQSAHDLFHRVQLYGDKSRLVQGAMVTGFDVEVLFLALKQDYRIKEVPVEWYHVPGSKVSPLRDSLRMLRDIASVRLNDFKGIYRA